MIEELDVHFGHGAIRIFLFDDMMGRDYVKIAVSLANDESEAVLGVIAVTRGRAAGAAKSGPAIAGIVCGVLALVIGIVFAVRFGTFIANNTSVFTTFDNCIARAGNRSAVTRFAVRAR